MGENHPARSLVTVMLLTGAVVVGGAEGAIRAVRLRCEHLENPFGVGDRTPRLSWEAVADGRGQRQTAWRIIVASSPEIIARREGDLWDTGRVEGDATQDHRYAGRPLRSNQPCW